MRNFCGLRVIIPAAFICLAACTPAHSGEQLVLRLGQATTPHNLIQDVSWHPTHGACVQAKDAYIAALPAEAHTMADDWSVYCEPRLPGADRGY